MFKCLIFLSGLTVSKDAALRVAFFLNKIEIGNEIRTRPKDDTLKSRGWVSTYFKSDMARIEE